MVDCVEGAKSILEAVKPLCLNLNCILCIVQIHPLLCNAAGWYIGENGGGRRSFDFQSDQTGVRMLIT